MSMVKKVFTGLIKELEDTKKRVFDLTDNFPDDAFMDEYNQETFDVAHNSFITNISNAITNLEAMNDFSKVLEKYLEPEALTDEEWDNKVPTGVWVWLREAHTELEMTHDYVICKLKKIKEYWMLIAWVVGLIFSCIDVGNENSVYTILNPVIYLVMTWIVLVIIADYQTWKKDQEENL